MPLPPWFGSPDSRLAKAVDPVTLPCDPVIAVAWAKASFTGAVGVSSQLSLVLPVARPYPSMTMRYVVPAVTLTLTELVRSPVPKSSLAPLGSTVSAPTADPV